MNRTIIAKDNSETIEVITDEFRFTIKRDFKGRLPDNFPQYQVLILNRDGATRLSVALDKWLISP